MFRNAIVLTPSPSLKYGISSSGLGQPDYYLALEQHKIYTETLRFLGLKVKVLPPNELFPDSPFIEDVALCTSEFAVITNPGAESRQGEIVSIKSILEEYYSVIETIKMPGTLEAGDVMKAGNIYFIGISGRTNNSGADQLIRILNKYNLTGSKVPLKEVLHLKSGTSYLENNNMLVCGEFINIKDFEKYNRIMVDEDESYAANSLWVNGKVLVPEGFPKTRIKIEKEGYDTIALNVSEFRKIDGGLSCLSLRF
jgi:dimethylargininase